MLIVEHRGDAIEVVDPAGKGLTVVTPTELPRTWKLGATKGRPWVGTISAR